MENKHRNNPTVTRAINYGVTSPRQEQAQWGDQTKKVFAPAELYFDFINGDGNTRRPPNHKIIRLRAGQSYEPTMGN